MTDVNVLGIVAEYNPYHNGHLYHLKKSKEIVGSSTAVAVMSGNFTQRGEPAILDKWKRAEIAIKNGVDLVIELPFLYACNSAEYFAEGAVKLLTALGVVDVISFGAEDSDIRKLNQIAEILACESAEFRGCLKRHSDSGLSFPSARQKAIEDITDVETALLLRHPNNTLAIEYLKQIKRYNSNLRPIVIQRKCAGYEELEPVSKIAGASALRRLLYNGKFEEALEYMPGGNSIQEGVKPGFAWLDHFYTIAAFTIRTKSISELNEVQSASEGLEYKMKKATGKATNMKSLISAIKSKRYTQTRIQRCIIHTIFGITRNTYRLLNSVDITYARVLGMNQNGRKLLKKIKNKSNITLITNLMRQKSDSCAELGLLDLDILASDIYNLVEGRDCYTESDFRKRPFVMI